MYTPCKAHTRARSKHMLLFLFFFSCTRSVGQFAAATALVLTHTRGNLPRLLHAAFLPWQLSC